MEWFFLCSIYICYLSVHFFPPVGLDWTNEGSIVSKAEKGLESDVYYCDRVEHFFLKSCLALWYVLYMCRFVFVFDGC